MPHSHHPKVVNRKQGQSVPQKIISQLLERLHKTGRFLNYDMATVFGTQSG